MIPTPRYMPLTKLIEKYQMLVMSLLYDKRMKENAMDPAGLVSEVKEKIANVKKHYNKYTTTG